MLAPKNEPLLLTIAVSAWFSARPAYSSAPVGILELAIVAINCLRQG